MTDLDTHPVLSVSADPWEADLARLRARFPKANASVLICSHELQQDEHVSLDDLKARAAMHGIRVTAASLMAGRRALGLSPPRPARVREVEVVDEPAGMGVEEAGEDLPAAGVAEERSPARRRRAAEGRSRADDVERLLREFVATADEERQRLREAVRRVIEVVDEVLG